MKEISLSGKYSHLKCKLDDDWAKMLEDGGIPIVYGAGYARVCSWVNKKVICEFLHDVIANTRGSSKYLVVDHVNRDKLDNRSLNLRVVTNMENLKNISNEGHRDAEIKVRGVSYDKERNSFSVKMFEDGKYLYNKRFKNIEDATLIAKFHNEIRFL